ncbi:hypothetical protein CEK25_002822 [Fusarium fujikuroi]|nr:hypothetical protein CEK25_002822 [Fusarium fujikuroi]
MAPKAAKIDKETPEGSDNLPEYLSLTFPTGIQKAMMAQQNTDLGPPLGFLAVEPLFISTLPAEHVRLAALSPIPVATSALVQVPSLLAIFPVNRPIGVLTYDSARLGSAHLLQLGIDPDRVRVRGLSDDSHLRDICARGATYDADRLEKELVAEVKLLIYHHPDISAVVLECTNMPPYANSIQNAIQLPVYDVYTMALWFYSGLTRRNPSAWKASDTGNT